MGHELVELRSILKCFLCNYIPTCVGLYDILFRLRCTATTPYRDRQKATFDRYGLRLPNPKLMNVYILAQAQGQTGYPSPEQR